VNTFSARATGDDRDKFISYVDSIAITIIVLINATIAAVTENNANDALAALSSLQTPESTVIRDGNEVQIKSREMVVGELIQSTPARVPALSLFLPAHVLRLPAHLPLVSHSRLSSFDLPHPQHRACPLLMFGSVPSL